MNSRVHAQSKRPGACNEYGVQNTIQAFHTLAVEALWMTKQLEALT